MQPHHTALPMLGQPPTHPSPGATSLLSIYILSLGQGTLCSPSQHHSFSHTIYLPASLHGSGPRAEPLPHGFELPDYEASLLAPSLLSPVPQTNGLALSMLMGPSGCKTLLLHGHCPCSDPRPSRGQDIKRSEKTGGLLVEGGFLGSPARKTRLRRE